MRKREKRLKKIGKFGIYRSKIVKNRVDEKTELSYNEITKSKIVKSK